jgi:phthiocerol/phenolphthiocerol synthesis type-I polyketide synthase E
MTEHTGRADGSMPSGEPAALPAAAATPRGEPETQPAVAAGIAVIGLAARFPGAPDAAAFWRNLRDGVEAISRFSDEELAAAGIDAAERHDPRYVPAKGVLAGAEMFDAALFGLTPREAEMMDPQHRVFLECAWEALEDAACDPHRFPGRAGIWAGAGANTYLMANLLPHRERLEGQGVLPALLLNEPDFLATRAAYALDLRGPSVTVQTACSTSLVAVHAACQSLLGGECDLALAGGVSISVPLAAGYLHEEGGVMSPDGHCRAFDRAAAGSVEGNGCGLVVLKRLGDALAQGDRIHGVIRGSAINNDGAQKVGFTAPGVAGQAEAISEALMMAGVDPETVGYVEAHGSGTPLGDPVEIAALTQAFAAAAGSPRAPRARSCAIGSVKTAIGHCNAAAGIAGLIKTLLALVHRTLPPSLHFSSPNPQLDLDRGPFYVPTRATPWVQGGAPRRAGVSSFGLGGTNAHVVVEEAPRRAPGLAGAGRWQLLPLSARTPAALAAMAARLADHLADGADPDLADGADPDLADGADPDLADVAWTLQTGRRELACRRTVLARDRRGAAAALRALPAAAAAGTAGVAAAAASAGRQVVFLFPGLGDQYVDMGRDLYEEEPVFRRHLDECAELLAPRLGADLRQLLFSPGERRQREASGAAAPDLRALLHRGAPPAAAAAAVAAAAPSTAASEMAQRLQRTRFAQPACFVVEYALGQLLLAWGLAPRAMIGYSLGEYVAACLAGSLSLPQALSLVAERARWIDELPAGAMLVVPLGEEEVRPLLAGGGADLALAATNGPHCTVVAGDLAAVAALELRLREGGTVCMRPRTGHAFHSRLMAPAAARLTAMAPAMAPPRIPWISNVTGTWVTARDLGDPGYWARHLCGTVRFAEGVGELLAEPEQALLEVGPGAMLGTFARQHPAAAAGLVTAQAMRRADEDGSDVEVLLAAMGRLWTAGSRVDWDRLHGNERRQRVALPAYPFERQRCWIDPPAPAGASAATPAAAGRATDLADWFWAPVWKRLPPPRTAASGGAGGGPGAAPAGQDGGTARRWLLLLPGGDGDGQASGMAAAAQIAARLAAGLRELGHEVSTVVPGPPGTGFAVLPAGAAERGGAFAIDPGRPEDYEALLRHLCGQAGGLPLRLVHLGSLTAGEPSFEQAQAGGLLSVAMLARAVGSLPAHLSGAAAGSGSGSGRLIVVANGLAEVLDGDTIQPAKATVLGALEVIPQEVPRLAAGAIDVVLPPAGPAAERLAERLLAEIAGAVAAGPLAPLLALRGRQRFVREFERVRLPAPPAAPGAGGAPGGRGDVCLVVLPAGPAQGPGLAIAEHLLRGRQARVCLLLPADFPPRAAWEGRPRPVGTAAAADTATAAAIDRLLLLEREAGGDGRLRYERADPEDAAAIRAAVAAARGAWGPLATAFWAGGGTASGLLQLKTPAALLAALRSVERGVEALLAALDEGQEAAPPTLVLCSTTTAVTGGLGLIDLAASGAWLAALAERREADLSAAGTVAGVSGAAGAAPGRPLRVRAIAIHWDPYQWGGWLLAGVGAGTAGLTPQELEAELRAHGASAARSAEALGRLLAGPLAAAVVSARDLHELMAETDGVTAESLLAQLGAGGGEQAARPALPTPYDQPRDELEERLAQTWQELFGIQPIGRDDNFLDLGGHSLLAIQVVTRLRQLLDVDLPVTTVFEAPTVAQLAALVRRARGEPDPAELEALLAQVEELSPAEAAARLAELGA